VIDTRKLVPRDTALRRIDELDLQNFVRQ